MPTERKPFHESVVDAIRDMSLEDGTTLAGLIKSTKIPKGHDEIAAAWRMMCNRSGLNMDTWGVVDDLMFQKKEVKQEAEEKKKSGVTA